MNSLEVRMSKTNVLRRIYGVFLYTKKYSVKAYTSARPSVRCSKLWVDSGRLGFNPRSRHTKDFKNGTCYLLA